VTAVEATVDLTDPTVEIKMVGAMNEATLTTTRMGDHPVAATTIVTEEGTTAVGITRLLTTMMALLSVPITWSKTKWRSGQTPSSKNDRHQNGPLSHLNLIVA
jgi:hypothetical protein